MSDTAKTEVRRYPAIGHCAYCPATEHLSSEHIIPFALGGRLELEDGSCSACARRTHAFEGRCVGETCGPARAKLGIKSRKRGVLNTVPIRVKGDGSFRNTSGERIEVDVDTFPMFVTMPVFPRAGFLVRKPPGELWNVGVRSLTIDPKFAEKMRRAEEQHGGPVGLSAIDFVSFGRMLAKIAISFAHAERRCEGFASVLHPLIEKPDERYVQQYISSDERWMPPSEELHNLSIYTLSARGHLLLVVAIQLFACFGMPVHHVIVGSNPEMDAFQGDWVHTERFGPMFMGPHGKFLRDDELPPELRQGKHTGGHTAD